MPILRRQQDAPAEWRLFRLRAEAAFDSASLMFLGGIWRCGCFGAEPRIANPAFDKGGETWPMPMLPQPLSSKTIR